MPPGPKLKVYQLFPVIQALWNQGVFATHAIDLKTLSKDDGTLELLLSSAAGEVAAKRQQMKQKQEWSDQDHLQLQYWTVTVQHRLKPVTEVEVVNMQDLISDDAGAP
jgi:hypothetical protein